MGWLFKGILLIAGLAAFGLGFWVFGTVCIAYVVFSSRRGRKNVRTARQGIPGGSKGKLLGGLFFSLGGIALGSGGTLSPILFFTFGFVLILWPYFHLDASSQVVPVQDSILMRSRFMPFQWHAIAELKVGNDDVPRALSSYQGKLLVLTQSGNVYVHATAFSMNLEKAASLITTRLREAGASIAAGGGSLLPLDGSLGFQILRMKVSRIRTKDTLFSQSGAGLLVFESEGGFTKSAGAYTIDGTSSSARVPNGGERLPIAPLTWELFEDLGKKMKWAEPDTISGFLASLLATRGEPIAARVGELKTSENSVSVQTLGGDTVKLSRPQLRALAQVYS